MGSKKQARRTAQSERTKEAEAPGEPATGQPARGLDPRLALGLAALAVFGVLAALRFGARAPWSYDEYYHLALARGFPLRSFPWAPYSIFADAFADKEPLFHLLLAPFAAWPLERSGLAGVLLGQLTLVGGFAFALRRSRAPHAWLFLLALPALGTLLVGRAEMCRPHVWLVAFAAALLAMLATGARWWSIAALSALFGLVHTGGWIGVPLSLLASLLALREGESARRFATWGAPLAAAGGWLAGQVVHPNFPANFRMAWIQNAVVVFQAASGRDEALQSQLGAELLPPAAALLRDQWPAFLLAVTLTALLLSDPALRAARRVLLVALPALAALAAGTFVLQRFFELGAPLCLLALAFAAAERERLGRPLVRGFAPLLAGVVFVIVGAGFTLSALGEAGYGRSSPPQGMARFLSTAGQAGERVFTAQWADSAPLLYQAPQLQSLVALDPTFFFVKDPDRFRRYVRLVLGAEAAPAAAVRSDFGSRWVSVWKAPVYERFARQLAATPGARVVFEDRDYLVFDLAGVAAR